MIQIISALKEVISIAIFRFETGGGLIAGGPVESDLETPYCRPKY